MKHSLITDIVCHFVEILEERMCEGDVKEINVDRAKREGFICR